mmetsp:Transcript_26445/g.99461  ORF Transcript_26445/g.99461 Transcript_26445/m.99461 type:complete len:282 (-) Transcript_26445:78-923(-)
MPGLRGESAPAVVRLDVPPEPEPVGQPLEAPRDAGRLRGDARQCFPRLRVRVRHVRQLQGHPERAAGQGLVHGPVCVPQLHGPRPGQEPRGVVHVHVLRRDAPPRPRRRAASGRRGRRCGRWPCNRVRSGGRHGRARAGGGPQLDRVLLRSAGAVLLQLQRVHLRAQHRGRGSSQRRAPLREPQLPLRVLREQLRAKDMPCWHLVRPEHRHQGALCTPLWRVVRLRGRHRGGPVRLHRLPHCSRGRRQLPVCQAVRVVSGALDDARTPATAADVWLAARAP